MNLYYPSKNIFIFVSVEWQCQIYAKIISSSKSNNLHINIIVLRPELDKNLAWHSINNHKVTFIDLSDQFKLSELSLLNSIISAKRIRYFLKKFIHTNSIENCTVITDNLYRVHELCLLSIWPKINRIILIPHGLTKTFGFLKLKNLISSYIRLFILFYIPRLLNNLEFFRISSGLKKVAYENNPQTNNFFISGNMQVKLSIDKLSNIKTNYQDTDNILFMGSGAFRYSNSIFDNRLTLRAIEFANNFCIKNNKKLFFKFKQDEDLVHISALQNLNEYEILNDGKNYIDLIKEIQPNYIFCSHISTVAAELLLSGYKVIIYDSGSFKGAHKSYSQIYKACNIPFQDLNSNSLYCADLKTQKSKRLLEHLIGCSDVNFNLIDECV